MSIVKYFKKNVLVTAVGDFTYDGNIGEGGNAQVLAFKKGEQPYAIKFLPHEHTSPLARFKDEYFCAAQIPQHRNVSRAYHLDQTVIEEAKYSLIVMKRYQSSLHKLGTIAAEEPAIKAAQGWKLLRALRDGIGHLHEHKIVHRDIKPQNIFFDQQEDTFVLGDLGIAYFAEDLYAREAETEDSERLANFSCCAPEQLEKNARAAPTMDVFALGQVLNWYVHGSFVRGTGRQIYAGSDDELKLLDRVIEKCIQNDPRRRFQSMEELKEFESDARRPPRDAWKPFLDLDEAFRESIPRMTTIYETTDPAIINRFLTNFSKRCDLEEFWYVLSDGGDNELHSVSKLASGRWLLHQSMECRVEKLICHKYSGLWQSFFVLLLSADNPFELTDPDGNVIPRPDMTGWTEDTAAFYEGRYMDMQDANSGYFLHGDEMIRIDFSKVEARSRFLRQDALLIIPAGTGPVASFDRTPNEKFLQNVAATGTTDMTKIHAFIEANLPFTDREIINRL